MTDGLERVPSTPDEHRAIRERIEAFALSEAADSRTRSTLTVFYEHWHRWNREHFGGELIAPLILIAEPVTPATYGDHSTVSGFGSVGQIRIRPSLVDGTHPVWSGTPSKDDRMRFCLDVVLHETIHQWQHETDNAEAKGYSGHGPRFRDKANEIGAVLGLERVRTCKRRGPDRDRPSCSHWPHNVRPAGYYGTLRGDVPIEVLTERAQRALRALAWRMAGHPTDPGDRENVRRVVDLQWQAALETFARLDPRTPDSAPDDEAGA